jgi:hypothetical protein
MIAIDFVYLAAQFERKEEMRKYRDELKELGITVTSRWIEPNLQEEVLDVNNLAQEWMRGAQYAISDFDDIRRSVTFIMFTNGLGRGGHHTELGIALTMNRDVIIIGKRENVFHCLSGITVFQDWETFISWLKELKDE